MQDGTEGFALSREPSPRTPYVEPLAADLRDLDALVAAHTGPSSDRSWHDDAEGSGRLNSTERADGCIGCAQVGGSERTGGLAWRR